MINRVLVVWIDSEVYAYIPLDEDREIDDILWDIAREYNDVIGDLPTMQYDVHTVTMYPVLFDLI